MVAPTGVEARMEMKIPRVAHTTEMTAEQMITLLKLRNTRMADNAGKMISADVSRAFCSMMPAKKLFTAETSPI